MTWIDVVRANDVAVVSRHDLIAVGATGHSLTAAVRDGRVLRVRRDHYALPTTDKRILTAARIGGRVGCVSALALGGVFAMETAEEVHVHVPVGASRLRTVASSGVGYTGIGRASGNRHHSRLHWSVMIDATAGDAVVVGIEDALAQVIRCQPPWLAVAALDNALHQSLISEASLTRIFAAVPRRFRYLRPLLDGRAESGQESVLRMIVQEAGLTCEIQVSIAGVGRVDMIVEGILVLEADSRLAHDSWNQHVVDRSRDLELARQGYMSLRPLFQHIMFGPDAVRDAVLTLLKQSGRFRGTQSAR